MIWLALAIIAPLLFAITNIIDDNLMEKVFDEPHDGVIIAGLFSGIPLLAYSFIPLTVPSFEILLLATLGGFLTVVSWFFYFDALRTEPSSVVVTVYGTQSVFTAIFAYLLLGEVLTSSQYIGAIIIFLSTFLITAIDIKKIKFSKIIPLMLLASVILATANLMADHVYAQIPFKDGFFFHLVGSFLAGCFFLAFFPKGRKFFTNIRKVKNLTPIFIIAEVVGIIAIFTYDKAIDLGPVTLVSVIAGIQPAYIILLSLVFYPFSPKHFREITHGHLLQKLLSIAVLIMGLYLINA